MPKNLINEIKEQLKKGEKKVVVLPESEDSRVLIAASKIQEEDFANIILLGDENEINNHADELKLDISKVKIINPRKFKQIDEFSEELAKLREKKGLTFEQAKATMLSEPRFFGAMLVRKGYAHGMVAGSNSPTAAVLRAAIQVIGPKEGLKTISSSFIMLVDDNNYGQEGTLIFSDCAVIPNPTANQIADIAISAVEKARKIAKIEEPKVALLTYSTKGSADGEVVKKMREARDILEERNVDFDFDGELQLDAAIVPEVANLKAKNSTVAGKANVLIFPDLSAGNIGYKLVQRLAKAQALGPFVQGLKSPVHDLSRGCSAEDIVGVVAVTAMEGE